MDITARPLIAEVLTHMWMTSFPSVQPSWEGPCGDKHNIQNSLPSIFLSVNLSTGFYDVDIHSRCPPSSDQQDMMNAMDATEAETTLPVSDSSAPVVKEEHLNPASDTSVPVSSSGLKEKD